LTFETLNEIAGITEKLVSLPILVWIWAMVRANRRSIDELVKSNKGGHAYLHKRIDALPCESRPAQPCAVPAQETQI